MSYYVILNFEDKNPNFQQGVAVQPTTTGKPAGIGGAAEGTLKIYRNRALKKSSVFSKKGVSHYSCQELMALDRAGALTKQDIQHIRNDCNQAKTIAVVIHGMPDETEHGFSTDGDSVATWGQLSNLALMLFPNRSKKFNIALIMCYAARSEDHKLNHQGVIPPEKLKTSFAYKFFRRICLFRNIRMSARTGAVSSDGDVNHTIENEEQVFYVIEKGEASQKRLANQKTGTGNGDDAITLQKNMFLEVTGTSPQKLQQVMDKFVQDPHKIPKGPLETFAKNHITYSNQVGGYLMNKFPDRNQTTKFGKLIYDYDGALTITRRYDDETGNGGNQILYHGPLL